MNDELAQIEAARRDRRAFAPLYENYADLVWRFAMLRTGDPDLAAEITSRTFARAIEALPAFRPRSDARGTTFRAWLMTIARNSLIDSVRRARPAISIDDPGIHLALVDGNPTPEELVLAGEEQRRVIAALRQLPATQRRIVELRLAGLKGAEIADALGMSVSAVNTAHFRAFARLREMLAETDATQGSTR